MVPMITILGLGPGAIDDLSLRAWEKIQNAATVYLRTARHPCVAKLAETSSVVSFDDVYQQHEKFEDVYDEIAARLLGLALDDGRHRLRCAGRPAGRRSNDATHSGARRRSVDRSRDHPWNQLCRALFVAIGHRRARWLASAGRAFCRRAIPPAHQSRAAGAFGASLQSVSRFQPQVDLDEPIR